MSNLRRSRPDEQDDLLRRLQEISMTRHRLDASDTSSPSSPRRLPHLSDSESLNIGDFSPGDFSPHQGLRDSVFLPEASPKALSPVSPKPRTILNLDFSRENTPTGSDSESSSPGTSDVHSRCGHIQLSLADDDKWHKLHCILMEMKEEPFDVEQSLKASVGLCGMSPEKLSSVEELQLQLAVVQDLLEDKRQELRQTQQERDVALDYIHNLKVNGRDTLSSVEPGKQVIDLYKLGIDSLRSPNVSKDNVIELILPLVQELHKQKSYLDRLVTVTLMRVPWILEEVDNMDPPDVEAPILGMDKPGEWR